MSGVDDARRRRSRVPLPFQAPFTYRVPEGRAAPERGVRVLVPFGGRRVIGVVRRRGDGDAPRPRAQGRARRCSTRRRSSPPPLLDLAAWVADHYLAPPGECYRLVLPPAGVRASRAVVRLLKPRRRPTTRC